MATADEIVVKLTAQTDQLKAGMAEASATVKASSDAMAASYQGAMQSFSAFEAIQKSSLGTAADVAAAQQAINAAQASGAFTAEELAAKQALVDAAMLKVGKETQAASGFLSMFTRNSRTMYSTSALITDAMTGQFSRMRREVAALGNETGLMGRAFGFIASPIGVAALAIAGLGVGVIEAQDHYDKFQQTILRTGNIIGMSAGELQTMADDIGMMTGHTFEAVDAVNALGASGRFTGDQLHVAAEAAVDFSTVTGEKVGKAAQIIESLQEKPKTAIAEVNDQFHFLTQSQADLIEKLLATGQNAQAAAVAVQAFHDAMAERADEMEQHTSALARDWHDVSGAIQQAAENLAEYIEVATGGGDVSEKLAVAQRQLAHDEEVASHSILYRWGLMHDEAQKYIDKEKEAVAELQKQQAAEDAAAQAKAKNAQATAQQFDKATHSGKHNGGSADSQLEAELKKEEADQKVSYGDRLQFALDYWNNIVQTAQKGSAEYVAAWKHAQDLQKQLDDQQLAASNAAERKRVEAARQTARQAADVQRAMDRDRKRSMEELQQEIKQESDQEIALARQAAEQKEKLALDDIATTRARYRLEFEQGKITAQQLVALEIQSAQERLAAETALYQALERLDAGNALKVQQDQFQIVDAVKKSQAQIAEITTQGLADQEKAQRKYQQVMEGAVTSQVNAMIFQHQRLRAAVANIAESMVETWIANEIKTVVFHDGAEASKTSATIAGNAARVAADTAGQGESLLVQGEAAVKWIMTEAAKAAAGAFNAMVSIPYVGPFLAVGASIAAFAAVSKLVSSVASAEGGWERVPADGMQTVLHKDEMVLPKHVADPVRKMAKNGGGGGDVHHHHYNMLDIKSGLDYLKRNPSMFAKAAAHAGRNGW